MSEMGPQSNRVTCSIKLPCLTTMCLKISVYSLTCTATFDLLFSNFYFQCPYLHRGLCWFKLRMLHILDWFSLQPFLLVFHAFICFSFLYYIVTCLYFMRKHDYITVSCRRVIREIYRILFWFFLFMSKCVWYIFI